MVTVPVRGYNLSKFIWEVGLGEFYTRPVSLHEAPSLVAVCGQRAVGASVVDQDNATLSVKGVWGNVAQHSECNEEQSRSSPPVGASGGHTDRQGKYGTS